MIKPILSRFTRRLLRQGQTGQTIVIMAFGFIVLLGFVGIVTDVSLMFVRYSTLRRAIDAAAVSAAGQMRRAVPNADEITRGQLIGNTPAEEERLAIGYAYARNVANVGLAARQFIELYGLSPTTVLVDTCATTHLPNDTYTDPQLECETTDEPRKLVRVTAQIASPTVFLRLLGWGTVTLEATAISETAVLDVVMIFDVSESMLNQTTYDDWKEVPLADGTPCNTAACNQSMRYYPPRMTFLPNAGGSQDNVNSVQANPAFSNDYYTAWTYALTHSQTDLNAYALPKAFNVNAANVVTSQASYNNPAGQPRTDCRVRFFPASGTQSIPDGGNPSVPNNPWLPGNDVRIELSKMMNFQGIPGQYAARWDGFVPAYNYFGCCNDPDGNFTFHDLVCQPMQKVRDASQDFLNRIDFSRGDRVGFVTFDRYAYLVDYDGNCPLPGCPMTPMMSDQEIASDALKQNVGVRADPSYYADTDNNGVWDHFVTGGNVYNPSDPNSKAIRFSGTVPSFNGSPLGGLNDYPAKDNCIFQNATLSYPLSLYSSPDQANSSPTVAGRPPYYQERFPNPLASAFPLGGVTIMHPDLNDAGWLMPAGKPMAYYSYEFRAACRGSNVGAGLRAANNALLDPNTIRTNNAVWVMVMLGDGAAAGSDPVRRNTQTLLTPQIYNGTNNVPRIAPIPGEYGVFGVCPYGVKGSPDTGALIDGGTDSSTFSTLFPYCSDKLPESRHFCFDPRIKDAAGNQYIDLNTDPACETVYDVDDFARDWTDFIGLSDPFPATVRASALGRENLQLPTIFTIGFGLDFQKDTGSCTDNVEDCLGEELLRYVADVGDNNRMDMDYQQDLRADKSLDNNLSPNEDWGARGPCEGPILGPESNPDNIPAGGLGAALVNPLPPKENCGNYFNAPDEDELQNVFDTIASRMFTRLTR